MVGRLILGVGVVFSAALLVTGEGQAQAAGSIQKSDMVRLLTGGAHTQSEIAALVDGRCLSFQPTERDIQDFRSLGAGSEVVGAIERCAAGEAVGPEAPRGPPDRPAGEGRAATPSGATPSAGTPLPETPDRAPAGGGPERAEGALPELTLFVSPRRAVTAPGREVEVAAEVTAGAVPVRGVLLELREVDAAGQPFRALTRTDARGRATFRIPGPLQPGVYRFSVASVGRTLQGMGEVRVEVAAEGGDPLAGSDAGSDGDAGGAGEGSTNGDSTASPEAGEAGSGPEPVEAGETGGSPFPASPGEDGDGATAEEELTVALEEAARLSRGGVYGSAEGLYAELLRRYPDSPEVRVGYAYHMARLGKHERAERVLGEAAEVAPDRLDVRKALAFVGLWRGETEEAVERFRELARVAPRDPEVWRGLGQALAESDRRKEAREAFRRARELEP